MYFGRYTGRIANLLYRYICKAVQHGFTEEQAQTVVSETLRSMDKKDVRLLDELKVQHEKMKSQIALKAEVEKIVKASLIDPIILGIENGALVTDAGDGRIRLIALTDLVDPLVLQECDEVSLEDLNAMEKLADEEMKRIQEGVSGTELA